MAGNTALIPTHTFTADWSLQAAVFLPFLLSYHLWLCACGPLKIRIILIIECGRNLRGSKVISYVVHITGRVGEMDRYAPTLSVCNMHEVYYIMSCQHIEPDVLSVVRSHFSISRI